MNTQHTPGPLKAEKGAEFDPGRWIIVADNGTKPWVIATIENGQPGDSLDTEEATAKLFAAAPELLEALIGVLKVADRLTDEFDAARAAIAKATQA